MDNWIFLLGGLVLILVTLLALLIHSGLFATIDVKAGNPPIGKCFIAYKDGTGSYSGVGSTFSESTSIAPSLKQIGIYYDNPSEVPEEKQRWAVGAILAENDEEVDESIRLAYEKEKYKFMTLPQVPTSVNCTFPYVTMISIFIAVKRVYPKLSAYVDSRRLEAYPIMEIYFGGYIHFTAPLSSQMDFYTPKALETEPKQASQEDLAEAKTTEPDQPIPDPQMKKSVLFAEPEELAPKKEVKEPDAQQEVKETRPEQENKELEVENVPSVGQEDKEPSAEPKVEETGSGEELNLKPEEKEPESKQEDKETKIQEMKPGMEQEVEEPGVQAIAKEPGVQAIAKEPVTVPEAKDDESDPDSDSSFEKVNAEDLQSQEAS